MSKGKLKYITRRKYADPMHAWLKVPYRELEELGIIAKISSFSYRDGNYVYLEEDCDMPLYIKAIKESGRYLLDIRPGSWAKRSSRIRNYTPYFFTIEIPKGKLIAGDSMDKQKEAV